MPCHELRLGGNRPALCLLRKWRRVHPMLGLAVTTQQAVPAIQVAGGWETGEPSLLSLGGGRPAWHGICRNVGNVGASGFSRPPWGF